VIAFVVSSKYFVAFKIRVTSSCNNVTVKNGLRIKCSELLLPVTVVK
jgi:hypothetical protein